MQCLPKAYQDIIVGLNWKGQFSWYVSEKEMWFMDLNKLRDITIKRFTEEGIPLSRMWSTEDDEERGNIRILSEESIDLFLPRISKYAASVDELREYLKLAIEIETREYVFFEYMPTLFIDFDKKVLYSMYTEPASFEDYVPESWQGYYQDFLDMIVPNERFWYENDKVLFDFRKGSDGK